MGNCPIFFRLSSVFMPVLWTIENCMTRDSFFSTSFLTNAWNDCVFFIFIYSTQFFGLKQLSQSECAWMCDMRIHLVPNGEPRVQPMCLWWCRLFCTAKTWFLFYFSAQWCTFSVDEYETEWNRLIYGWAIFILKSISYMNDKTFSVWCWCRPQ